MSKKTDENLEKYIHWIMRIQKNIDTHRSVLFKNEHNTISEFQLLYFDSTNSYFLTILRNLIDENKETSSLFTFLLDFIKEEEKLLYKRNNQESRIDENLLLNELTNKKIFLKDKKKEISKNYNKWMNGSNSHINTKIQNDLFNKTSLSMTYKSAPIEEVIECIEALLNIFQDIILMPSNESKFRAYIYPPP